MSKKMYEAKLSERLGNQVVAVYADDVVDALAQLIGRRPLALTIRAVDIIYIKPFDN